MADCRGDVRRSGRPFELVDGGEYTHSAQVRAA
jgi:hypothetical protein